MNTKRRSEMALYLFDIGNRHLSEIPGTKGLWSPRWSPDGRYIAAITTDSQAIGILCWPGSQWKELVRMRSVDNATWSADSRFIQFNGHTEDMQEWLFRLHVPEGRLERVTGLTNLTWPAETWWGIAPDGTPLGLAGIRAPEIFELKCDLP